MLESLIKKHFKESRLTNLYWKMVKAGYVEWDTYPKRVIPTIGGVPQGGIISPLLSNLVLHELDEFIEKRRARARDASPAGPGTLKKKEEAGVGQKKTKDNPKYKKLSNQIRKLKQEE
jgi:retron-type reverse transcriptase